MSPLRRERVLETRLRAPHHSQRQSRRTGRLMRLFPRQQQWLNRQKRAVKPQHVQELASGPSSTGRRRLTLQPILFAFLFFFFTATNDRSDVSSTQRISVVNSPRHRCTLGHSSPKFTNSCSSWSFCMRRWIRLMTCAHSAASFVCLSPL